MRCAVLGSPIAHSLSPAMHRTAYAELGLADWTYEAVDVAEDALSGFLAGLDGDWRGLSLTMPLKRVALGLVERTSEVATVVGSVNTILLGPDDGRGYGDNTDVPGAQGALRERGLMPKSARIVGGGATATSIAYTLAALGLTDLEFVVRDEARAAVAAEVARSAGADVIVKSFEHPLLEKVDLLVSTVPGDAIGSRSHEMVASSRAVFDVAYDPWPTPLASAAEQAGLEVVTGIDLLAHQAALQVELMTGSDIDPDVLRRAALAALTH